MIFFLDVFLSVFNGLSLSFREKIALYILKILLLIKPSLIKTAKKNFSIVFPNLTEIEKEALLKRHLIELSRLLVDTLRVDEFTKSWSEKNVSFTNSGGFTPFHGRFQEKGAVLCSAHLGPFEPMAQILPHYGLPLNFIARAFKSEKMNKWWIDKRSKTGSKYIPRQGAALGVLRAIKKKEIAGIIFDQNVTRDNALFINLFGLKAATTKIVPYALLKTKVPLFFISSKRTPDGKIIVSLNEIEYLSGGAGKSEEEASTYILETLHRKLETAILDYPEGWFWFHKRWKTRPEGEVENLYI